jgi:hypothetical protein
LVQGGLYHEKIKIIKNFGTGRTKNDQKTYQILLRVDFFDYCTKNVPKFFHNLNKKQPIKIIFQVKIHITQVIASNCLQIHQEV